MIAGRHPWKIWHLGVLVLVAAIACAAVKEPVYLLVIGTVLSIIPAGFSMFLLYRDLLLDRGRHAETRPVRGYFVSGINEVVFRAFAACLSVYMGIFVFVLSAGILVVASIVFIAVFSLFLHLH